MTDVLGLELEVERRLLSAPHSKTVTSEYTAYVMAARPGGDYVIAVFLYPDGEPQIAALEVVDARAEAEPLGTLRFENASYRTPQAQAEAFLRVLDLVLGSRTRLVRETRGPIHSYQFEYLQAASWVALGGGSRVTATPSRGAPVLFSG